MQTALTEVLPFLVLALVIEEAVEVFDPGVVEFAGFLNEQQIDAGHVFRPIAEVVYNHPLVPAKYVYC